MLSFSEIEVGNPCPSTVNAGAPCADPNALCDNEVCVCEETQFFFDGTTCSPCKSSYIDMVIVIVR